MRMPFATSMNASFCGVVTMTAALKPTVCAWQKLLVSGLQEAVCVR